jgi:hypothetical protein
MMKDGWGSMFVLVLWWMMSLPAAASGAHGEAARACEAGEAERCHTAGQAYEKGLNGAPKDPFRAVQLFRMGCRGEHKESCLSLAILLEEGVGDEVDPGEVQEAYKGACQAGSGMACRRVGEAYVLSAANPRDAQLWYGLGCELQDASSCTAAALAHERGDAGMGPDFDRARRYYLAACRFGSGRGCTLLGYRYSRGLEGLKRDDAGARLLFTKACEASDPEGCRYLAQFQEQGRGAEEPDSASARHSYDRGCRAGDAVSCREVATALFAEGDYRGAMLAGKRGCELGDAKGCKLQARAEAKRP